jgi:hypothetical protein
MRGAPAQTMSGLYYYIFVSSRAATILGSPASWGRLVACGRLSIGQMPLTSSTPRLRLAAMYYYIFVSSRAATNFGVAPVALLHFCFFARRDEFLSGFLQLTEDGYAGAIHSQNRSDRKSAVRGDLVAMGFGDFLNQAVGAQESKLAADRR